MTITAVGTIVRQLSSETTRYYWYPGDKREWIKAGVAVGTGLLVLIALLVTTHNPLASVTLGASVTAVITGANFGRRDFRATHSFPELSGKAARRAAMVHGGRAAWRGLVQGICGAAAAALIANLRASGLFADWVLPVLPAVAGALAHQGGMLYERLALAGAPKGLPPLPTHHAE